MTSHSVYFASTILLNNIDSKSWRPVYYKAKVREARIVRDHHRVVQRAIDLGKCVAVGQNKRFLSLSLSS